MTEHEAKDCMQGKLDCMNKCDVFDCKGTDECEGCNFCYAQGTFGEQKEALQMAINALGKQIPKKPLIEYHCGLKMLCPTCNCEVSDIEHRGWSCKCGQKLDWEEAEKALEDMKGK